MTHWDKVNATLRGYKLYRHNADFDWRANPDELRENRRSLQNNQEPLTKNLKPLQAGTKFISKIRFQNLSAIELGSLMMIFNLDGAKRPAYKIGMGKSLGLGSVEIKLTLFVETDGGFINPYAETPPTEYLQAFNNYVDAQNMTAAWQKVMNELKLILNWDSRTAPDKIKPIQSNFNDRNNLFLQRAVLLTPAGVVKSLLTNFEN